KVVNVYLHVAKGRIDVNGKTFNTGDAARIRDGEFAIPEGR
ncbi:quercetin 2,3-dioxygenase, partial [Acinetobacter baumannii]